MQKALWILSLALMLLSPRIHAEPVAQTVWIPMTKPGSEAPIRLEATLYKPDGEGPFPVMIYNHGSTGPGVIPKIYTETPRDFARYLNKKGIAALAPMRRGRGKSDGEYRERYGCSESSVRAGINYASESLDAAIDYLKGQSWADTEKMMISGHSRGGMLSVVYAAEHPGLFLGVINFSGGWVGDSCKGRLGKDLNQMLLAEAGEKAKQPNLFLYGANDSYYSDRSIEGFAGAFEKAGGELRFELFPLSPGANGHALYYDFSPLWTPLVDELFERLKL